MFGCLGTLRHLQADVARLRPPTHSVLQSAEPQACAVVTCAKRFPCEPHLLPAAPLDVTTG